MAEIISLLSGKGGVGKTSIAVNIAHYAAQCGIKVLLVDCDTNTNGATTFYRLGNRLPINMNKYLTFQSILEALFDNEKMSLNKNLEDKEYIEIEKNLDFIPAQSSIRKTTTPQILKSDLDKNDNLLYKFMEEWSDKYQIVIIDQVAGYTPLTSFMAGLSSAFLIVYLKNEIDMESVRNIAGKIINEFGMVRMLFCQNRVPRSKYGKVWDDLVGEYKQIEETHIGFQYSNAFNRKITQGCVVDILHYRSIDFHTISSLSEFVFKRYRKRFRNYNRYIEEKWFLKFKKEMLFFGFGWLIIDLLIAFIGHIVLNWEIKSCIINFVKILLAFVPCCIVGITFYLPQHARKKFWARCVWDFLKFVSK